MSLQSTIIDILKASDPLMALLTGGVHDRRIARNVSNSAVPTPGSTPEAFEINEQDGKTSGRIKPCAYVVPSVDTANQSGPRSSGMFFPVIVLRSLPRRTEKEKLESAYEIIYDLIHDQQVPSYRQTGCMLTIIGYQHPVDDDVELKGTVVSTIRIQGDGLFKVQL